MVLTFNRYTQNIWKPLLRLLWIYFIIGVISVLTSPLQLLMSRRFSPFFITQFLGALNDCIYKSALIVLVTYQISNSQLLVSIASALFILPFFIFSAIAGQFADKFNKTRLTQLIKIFELSFILTAAYGFYFHHTWLLMLILFLLGAHSAFFSPIKYAILPEFLEEDELLAANALIEAGTFIAILGGTLIGGLAVTSNAYITILSIIMGIIALLGLISSLFMPSTKTLFSALKIDFNILKTTRLLISHARDNKEIFNCIMGISWFWFLGSAFLNLFPYFTKDTIGGDEHVLTILLVIFALGITAGSWMCIKILRGIVSAKYVPVSVLMISFCILLLCSVSKGYSTGSTPALIDTTHFLLHFSSWVIMLTIFLVAFFGALYVVPLYTLLQVISTESERARVISSNNLISSLFMVLSSLFVIGLLSLHFTIAQTIFTLAILNSLVAIFACKLLPHEIIQSFLKWLLIALYKVEVKGFENYHAAGPRVIIIANHVSFIDALLIAAFIPDRLIFAISALIVEQWRWLHPFLALVDAFKIAPDKPMSIKPLIKMIRDNKKCIIFPEGRVTLTGALMKIYEGPGMIADKADATILPIRIEGAQFTPFTRLKGKIKGKFFPKIRLTILPPIKLNIAEPVSGRKRRQILSEKLYDVMTEMLFITSPYKKTLFEALLDARRIHGGKHIIAEDIGRKPIHYNRLIMQSFILGKLIASTSSPKEYIGVMLPTSLAAIATFFAIQAYGRRPVMLNFTSGIANVSIACTTTQLRIIYTARRFIEMAHLQSLVAALQEQRISIIYLEDLKDKISLIDKISGWVASLAAHYSYRKNCHAQSADPAVILFTSGSEGTPKGVALSHENILANCYQTAARVPFNSRDIAFNPLPMFHSFGLTGATLLPIMHGVKVFLYPSPLHFRIIPELIYDIGATVFFATDTFLRTYAKYAHPYDFYTVNYIFAGAEKIKEETHHLWAEKFGKRILEGYGTTETSPVIAVNTPMQNKRGTVGRLLPGMQYKLVPIEGIHEGAKFLVAGTNIMLGYILADKPTIINPTDWHDTGDIVTLDEQGYITIRDRVKRFAKIAGEMISLTAVENIISECWPNQQHAAINIPDSKKGERIILITDYKQASYDVMLQLMRAKNVSELSIPKQILIKDKLPLLGTGKIDYVTLKNELLGYATL